MDKELLSRIIKISSDGIIVLEENFTVIRFNRFAEKASGRNFDSVYGKNLFEIFPEIKETRLYTAIQNAVLKKENSFLTYTINKYLFPFYTFPEKKPMKQKITVSPIELANKNKFVLIQIKDETSIYHKETLFREKSILEKELNEKLLREFQKKEIAEKELLKSQKALEEKNKRLVELNKEKNEILGIVAHDLKNPLLIIKKISEDILSQSQIKELQNYLQIIKQSSIGLLGLVSNLLEINSIESKVPVLNLKEINIFSLLKEVIEFHKFPAFSKRIFIEIPKEDSEIMITTDESKLSQIIHNFISNAIKFSPHDSTVTVQVLQSKEFIQIEVLDEGQSVPESEVEFLFIKYKKLTPRPTAGESSNGLGLFIVKKNAEALAGKVYYKRREKQGSLFGVQIPILYPEKIELPKATFKSYNCLFIDDDPLILKLYSKTFTGLGHNCIIADSGSAAISVLEHQEFDLIFIDYHLRNESGEEVLQKIQAHFPYRKFYAVLTTADSVAEDREAYRKLGFQDSLTKNYNAESLHKVFIDYENSLR